MKLTAGDIVLATGVSSKRTKQAYAGVVAWAHGAEVCVLVIKQRRVSTWIVSRSQIIGTYYKTLKDIGEDEGWRRV